MLGPEQNQNSDDVTTFFNYNYTIPELERNKNPDIVSTKNTKEFNVPDIQKIFKKTSLYFEEYMPYVTEFLNFQKDNFNVVVNNMNDDASCIVSHKGYSMIVNLIKFIECIKRNNHFYNNVIDPEYILKQRFIDQLITTIGDAKKSACFKKYDTIWSDGWYELLRLLVIFIVSQTKECFEKDVNFTPGCELEILQIRRGTLSSHNSSHNILFINEFFKFHNLNLHPVYKNIEKKILCHLVKFEKNLKWLRCLSWLNPCSGVMFKNKHFKITLEMNALQYELDVLEKSLINRLKIIDINRGILNKNIYKNKCTLYNIQSQIFKQFNDKFCAIEQLRQSSMIYIIIAIEIMFFCIMIKLAPILAIIAALFYAAFVVCDEILLNRLIESILQSKEDTQKSTDTSPILSNEQYDNKEQIKHQFDKAFLFVNQIANVEIIKDDMRYRNEILAESEIGNINRDMSTLTSHYDNAIGNPGNKMYYEYFIENNKRLNSSMSKVIDNYCLTL